MLRANTAYPRPLYSHSLSLPFKHHLTYRFIVVLAESSVLLKEEALEEVENDGGKQQEREKERKKERERERERGRQSERQRDRERNGES